MLRALVYGLAILHLGPGIAFAVLAFGCDPVQPLLGAFCQKDALRTFLGLTVALWAALAGGSLVFAAWGRRGARDTRAEMEG